MSYIENNDAFSGEIKELSFDEIEGVGGGLVPLLAIAYVGIGLSVGTLAFGGGVVFGLRANEAVRLK